jgi:glycosyltransferase involved in cell wall biosynthesis
MRVSFASPVYNESVNIQEFISRVDETLKKITNDYEIILVNDASSDNTLTKIRDVLPNYPNLKLINLTKNSGQHIASSIALKHTTGDYIFLMDSDLQVNPEYMEEMFCCMQTHNNCDAVSARRLERSSNLSRRIGSFAISFLTQLIVMRKTHLKDPGSSFKLFSRNTLDKLISNDILIQNYPILMLNLRLNIIELPIKYNTTQIRESNYRFTDLIFVITLALLNFSTGAATLLILLLLGGCCSIVGGVAFFYTVIQGMLTESPLPTNLLIFFLSLIVIGLQFFLMSMIVFKLERINKNFHFRRAINQKVEYEN